MLTRGLCLGSQGEPEGVQEERTKADGPMGPTIGKGGKVAIADVTEEYLKEGWAADANQGGLFNIFMRSDTVKTGKSWTKEEVRRRI